MRDIRSDLQERLDHIEAEMLDLQERLDGLEEQQATIGALLDSENRRWGTEDGTQQHSRDLSDLILDIMSDKGMWLGGTVVDALLKRGYNFGSAKPGRVVHFTLLGMSRRGLVEHLGGGEWKLKPQHGVIEDHAA